MPRKRRRGATTGDKDDVDEYTAALRERQRALQSLAITLREQGRVYRKQPFRIGGGVGRADDDGNGGGGGVGDDVRLAAATRTAATATRIRERIERRCECVVIPIFWESRAAEKSIVRLTLHRSMPSSSSSSSSSSTETNLRT